VPHSLKGAELSELGGMRIGLRGGRLVGGGATRCDRYDAGCEDDGLRDVAGLYVVQSEAPTVRVTHELLRADLGPTVLRCHRIVLRGRQVLVGDDEVPFVSGHVAARYHRDVWRKRLASFEFAEAHDYVEFGGSEFPVRDDEEVRAVSGRISVRVRGEFVGDVVDLLRRVPRSAVACTVVVGVSAGPRPVRAPV
jgi:hypothetical protein